MSNWQTGGQRKRDNRKKNKKRNKRYINTNTEANANSKRKQTWQERWTETEKEIGRREGGNRKGKLGESLALVAGVAKGWLGWAGTRVGKGLIFPTPHVWGGGTNERGGIVH